MKCRALIYSLPEFYCFWLESIKSLVMISYRNIFAEALMELSNSVSLYASSRRRADPAIRGKMNTQMECFHPSRSNQTLISHSHSSPSLSSDSPCIHHRTISRSLWAPSSTRGSPDGTTLADNDPCRKPPSRRSSLDCNSSIEVPSRLLLLPPPRLVSDRRPRWH